MAGKVRRGRPPKPRRLKRVWRLQLLLTAAEHKALSQYAARQEMTASEIVRGCLRTLLKEQSGDDSKKGGTE